MQAVTSPEHVHQRSLVSSQSKMQFFLHLPTNPNLSPDAIKGTCKTTRKGDNFRSQTHRKETVHTHNSPTETHEQPETNQKIHKRTKTCNTQQ